MNELKLLCADNKVDNLYNFIFENKDKFNSEYMDYNVFKTELDKLSKDKIKIAAKEIKLLRQALAVIDENAKEVILKKQKDGTIVFEKDPDLSDTEQVPLLFDGGIDEYFKQEVLPYAPDTWVDYDKTKTGYELSFTKYFYKPTKLRSLDEIELEIASIEKEAQELLAGVMC